MVQGRLEIKLCFLNLSLPLTLRTPVSQAPILSISELQLHPPSTLCLGRVCWLSPNASWVQLPHIHSSVCASDC